MDAAINPEQGASSLEQILRVSLEEEEEAIRVYAEILESLRLKQRHPLPDDPGDPARRAGALGGARRASESPEGMNRALW